MGLAVLWCPLPTPPARRPSSRRARVWHSPYCCAPILFSVLCTAILSPPHFLAQMSDPAEPSAASETSSAASELLTWLRPFGVHTATTGLALHEGSGPAERGLRTVGHVHITAQRGRSRDECSPAETAACSCCAVASAAAARAPTTAAPVSPASPAPYGCSSCARCFPAAPLLAPMISIPGALLITPIKVRQSALAQSLLLPAHIARATDSQVRFVSLALHHRGSE